MVKAIKRKKTQKRQKKKKLDRTILIDNHSKVSQVIDHSDQSFLNVDHESVHIPKPWPDQICNYRYYFIIMARIG